MADLDRRDAPQLVAVVGRVEGGGDALAPRRRAQPREVDDVEVVEQLVHPVQCGRDVVGERVDQHHLGHLAQRVLGDRVAVRRPDERREVGDDQRRDDRRQRLEVLLADVDLDVLAGDRRATPLSSVAIDAQASSVVRLRLDGDDDRARRVVAADLDEPVLDLAAVLAIADRRRG